MTYEQKLSALQAIAECQLCMRKPGDWYVSHRAEIKNGSMLEGRYGNGKTPEEAVENHWMKLTTLKPDERVVTNAMNDRRRELVWNGFMWEERP